MSPARNRRLPWLRALASLGLAAGWAAVACGGPQSLGGAGAVCFRADDCRAGLACVPAAPESTKRVCSADLSGIVSMVDGAAPDAGDLPDATGGSSGAAQGGDSASAGTQPGGAGKPATGGAPGASGAAPSAGAPAAGSASAGAPAGGSAAAGASTAGGPSGGNGGAASGGASAGAGG